jgi:hypothetical protein
MRVPSALPLDFPVHCPALRVRFVLPLALLLPPAHVQWATFARLVRSQQLLVWQVRTLDLLALHRVYRARLVPRVRLLPRLCRPCVRLVHTLSYLRLRVPLALQDMHAPSQLNSHLLCVESAISRPLGQCLARPVQPANSMLSMPRRPARLVRPVRFARQLDSPPPRVVD